MGRLVLLALVLLVVGCKEMIIQEAVTEPVETALVEPEPITEDIPDEPTDYTALITGVEGDLLMLKPKAVDPDGDVVTYKFSRPFNEDGKWQTQIGDEGEYLITVKAYDGIDYTSNDILVRVLKANRPPVLDCPDKITVNEGEKITIDCDITDPEGEEVIVSYRGFMTTSQYETTYADAGEHNVIVTAWDKTHSDKKVEDSIIIEILAVNRPPEIIFKDITASEGDVVKLDVVVNDPEGKRTTIEYSDPFNDEGYWRTKIGDAGTYDSSITVSDGENSVTKKFEVVIQEVNTAPIIKEIPDIFVDEGETIILDIDAKDREDDDLYMMINGFMDNEEYTTSYEDAYPDGCSRRGCTAEYTVTILVNDGELETSQDLRIYIRDKNRPPVFRVPG